MECQENIKEKIVNKLLETILGKNEKPPSNILEIVVYEEVEVNEAIM